MENTLIFSSEEEVRFGKLLKYIIPTYLTSLFNTVYTIIDGHLCFRICRNRCAGRHKYQSTPL